MIKSAPPRIPTLIFHPGLPDQRTFDLASGTTTIGRTRENGVHVAHQSLSRSHARIDVDGERWRITDLKSKNGTSVNGARIAEAELRPGDSIRCGDVLFTVADPSGPAPRISPTTVHEMSGDLSRMTMEQVLGVAAAARTPSGLRVKTDEGPERARDKLRILLRVSQLLSSPEKIDALLEKILDLVFQILDVDRAAILMLDERTGSFEPRVSRASPRARPGSQLFSRQIVDYVRKNSVAALFSDARVDPRLDTGRSIMRQSICASMCAPLRPRDHVIGALYVDNQSVPDRFSDDDLDFLGAFANQAAIAIDNATLYQRIEEDAVLRSSFLRFFPPSTIQRMMTSPAPSLEVIDTEVTELFADISGFTEMSSRMAPREVVELLNDYFPTMARSSSSTRARSKSTSAMR